MVLRSVSAVALALAVARTLAEVTLDDVPLVQRSFNEVSSDLGGEAGVEPTEDKPEGILGIVRANGALSYGSHRPKARRAHKPGRALLTGGDEEEQDSTAQCTTQERLNIKEKDAEIDSVYLEKGKMATLGLAPDICKQGPLNYDTSPPCITQLYDISEKCGECPRMAFGDRFESCQERCRYEGLYCPEDEDDVVRSHQCFTAMGVCDGCRMPYYRKRMRCEGGLRNETRTFKAYDNFVEECEAGTMTSKKYAAFRQEVKTKNVEDPPMPKIEEEKPPPKNQAKPGKPPQSGKPQHQPRPEEPEPEEAEPNHPKHQPRPEEPKPEEAEPNHPKHQPRPEEPEPEEAEPNHPKQAADKRHEKTGWDVQKEEQEKQAQEAEGARRQAAQAHSGPRAHSAPKTELSKAPSKRTKAKS